MRFGKLQVLVDISSQQKEHIWLGNVKQKIIYADWPLRCEGCNSLGHLESQCRKLKEDEATDKVEQFDGKKVRYMPEEEEGEWQRVEKRKKNAQPKLVNSRQVWEKRKSLLPLSGNNANPFNILAESNEQGFDTWKVFIGKPNTPSQPFDLIVQDPSHQKNSSKHNLPLQPFCSPKSKHHPKLHQKTQHQENTKNQTTKYELGEFLRFDVSKPPKNR